MAKQKRPEKRDAYTVALEHIYSNFKIFGENLNLFREQTSDRFDRIDERIEKIDARIDRIDARLDKIDGRLVNAETELALIRHNQVTRDEFKFLEARVVRLERKLK